MYNETQSYLHNEARRQKRDKTAPDFTPLQQVACWIFAFVFFTGLLLIAF